MALSMHSSIWHRVAALRPRLRAHVTIHRHMFRGNAGYVVQDAQSGRFHRLSTPAYRLVCLMDGRRTSEEIWSLSGEMLGADQPTQDDFIRLLGILHAADLTLGGVVPHMEELDARASQRRWMDLVQRLRNPISLRFRLFDPDPFLTATVGWVRPLFTPAGFFAWLALILLGGSTALVHFAPMAQAAFDHALSAQNLMLIAVIFPVMKLIHEFGHAYAVKVSDGEVHEIGVMLLVFVPVPYVDASASIAFREKWRRVIVGAAGIMVEMALAAGAAIVWPLTEPGLVRAVALNVLLLGGLSTVIFNGNPLLRFDGYYVLSDLIGIPNLAARANAYVMHLLQRYVLGVPDLEVEEMTPGEQSWLIGFAVGSFAYRMAVLAGIALFVASRFFFIGVAIALFVVGSALVKPVVQAGLYLTTDPRLRPRRRRALISSAALVGLAVFMLGALPVRYATLAPGVLWVTDDAATVRAQGDGVLAEAAHREPAATVKGEALVRLADPLLEARAQLVEKQTEELRIRLDAVDLSDRAQANELREQLRNGEGQLADIRRTLAELVVHAPATGQFLPLDLDPTTQRFVHKGDVLGYVVQGDGLRVRAMAPQTELDGVRRATEKVEVVTAAGPGAPLVGQIERIVPAAVEQLPHPALATSGGGSLIVDPTQPEKLKPLEVLFEVDVRVPALSEGTWLGMRAYVKFEHPAEPLIYRFSRAMRQVFLRQLRI